jgi:hypothetical protein
MADFTEGTRAQDAQGNIIVYQGGQWRPEGSGQQSYTDMAGDALKGAASTIGESLTSGSPLAPLTAIAGAVGLGPNIPEVPNSVAGMAGAIGTGLALGGTPGAAKRLIPGVTHPLESATAMADAIGGKLSTGGADAIVEKAGRVLKGFMTPAEVEATGATLSKANRMGLEAATPEAYQAAKVERWKEGLRGTDPAIATSQKNAFTNTIKSELGMTGPENLTPAVVSDILKTEGSTIGSLTNATGPLAMPAETITGMRDLVKLAPRDAKGPINLVLKDLEANAAANGGKVTPDAYQYALTNLGEIAAPGGSAERIMYGSKVLDKLHDVLQKNLTGPELDALKSARYRYKIGKTLQEGAAVGPDGLVNPASFGNRWDKKTGQTLRGKDVIGQAADTFNYLATQEANAGTTLQRLWNKGIGQVKENPLATAGTAGGAVGLTSLFR